MTWIKTKLPSADNPELLAALQEQSSLYPSEYGSNDREEGRLSPLVANDSIVLSHSLIPAALRHAPCVLDVWRFDGPEPAPLTATARDDRRHGLGV